LTRFPEQLPERLPGGVRHFDYVPFTQLLPHAAALVHHGGIGSSSQALAAGVPQLVMPMAHDQHDNAARLARLGVAQWLRPRAFRGPAVTRALKRLLSSDQVALRCREAARRLAADGDPLGRACDVIERLP
jgi:UDP:flavonoid glycosyltransferase YjiC (YdhE family)